MKYQDLNGYQERPLSVLDMQSLMQEGGLEAAEGLPAAMLSLEDRLMRVRRLGGMFQEIEFSPDMKLMLDRQRMGAQRGVV